MSRLWDALRVARHLDHAANNTTIASRLTMTRTVGRGPLPNRLARRLVQSLTRLACLARRTAMAC